MIPAKAKRQPRAIPNPLLARAPAPDSSAADIDVPAGLIKFRDEPHISLMTKDMPIPLLPSGAMHSLARRNRKRSAPKLPYGQHELTEPLNIAYMVQLAAEREEKKRAKGKAVPAPAAERGESKEEKQPAAPLPVAPPQTLAVAVPVGWEVVAECPALNSMLVGQSIVFQFSGSGWQYGKIKRHYDSPKGRCRQYVQLRALPPSWSCIA